MTKDDYISKRYSDDDIKQLVEFLVCASDDLEDNLLCYTLDSERQKVFEISKTYLNKGIQILSNYLTRLKYKEI